MKCRFISITSLFLAGMALVVIGQEPAVPGRPQLNADQLFKQFDKHSDGKLTADELPNANLLKYLDKDGDGVISKHCPVWAQPMVKESRLSLRESTSFRGAKGDTQEAGAVVPARFAITPRMLMSHSSGLYYGDIERGSRTKAGNAGGEPRPCGRGYTPARQTPFDPRVSGYALYCGIAGETDPALAGARATGTKDGNAAKAKRRGQDENAGKKNAAAKKKANVMAQAAAATQSKRIWQSPIPLTGKAIAMSENVVSVGGTPVVFPDDDIAQAYEGEWAACSGWRTQRPERNSPSTRCLRPGVGQLGRGQRLGLHRAHRRPVVVPTTRSGQKTGGSRTSGRGATCRAVTRRRVPSGRSPSVNERPEKGDWLALVSGNDAFRLGSEQAETALRA